MATVRYLITPITHGLTDVIVDVYDGLDAHLAQYTMTEIGNTGVYSASINVTTGDEWAIVSCPSMNLTDIVRVAPTIQDVYFDTQSLFKAEYGAWKIQGSQMIFYDQSGQNVIATFNLLDQNGNPVTNPSLAMQRVPV